MKTEKFKTLWDSKIGEFALIDDLMGQSALFTCSIPKLLPKTATLEALIDYYKDKSNIEFEGIELIDIEIKFDKH